MLLFELENVQEFLRCFGQRQLWVVGDDEGSAGEFFLDVQGKEFTIVGYAVVRDKGDAETDADDEPPFDADEQPLEEPPFDVC